MSEESFLLNPVPCRYAASMNATDVYGIIVNSDHQFAVWRADRHLPPGWRFTGPTGPRAEMLTVLQQQFVETVAAPLLTPGRLPRVTEWATELAD